MALAGRKAVERLRFCESVWQFRCTCVRRVPPGGQTGKRPDTRRAREKQRARGREAKTVRKRFERIIKDLVSSLITPSEKTAPYVLAYLH